MLAPNYSSVSVDCVLFGFDGSALKCLLVERSPNIYKLPGSLIYENEDIPSAAYRILVEMTGVNKIFLKEFSVFSAPNRLNQAELLWINEHYKVNTTRVVTVAYYALVKLDSRIRSNTKYKNIIWRDVEQINKLAMDHKTILTEALSVLTNDLLYTSIAFELLPPKFTIKALKDLYEIILGIEIDDRNFRKKLKESEYLVPTGEREQNVAHKPAEYYIFDKHKYKKQK